MPSIDRLTTYISDEPVGAIIVGIFALIVLGLSWLMLRAGARVLSKLLKTHVASRPAEDVLTIIAASIATGVSAQGMWNFSGDVLGFDGPLRLLLFAFIEVAVITSAVRARRNMRENYSAGIDGIAVWVLTALTAVLASMDSRSLPEAVFRLSAPLVAAWLWERGMAIERSRITGRSRINWRITPERIFIRLGLAEVSDRTAGEVDAHRRLTKVALAAKRARALREAGASERKMRAALAKLDQAMDQAIEHTGLAFDPERQKALLAQIGALYNTSTLIDLAPPVPWEPQTRNATPPALAASSRQPYIDDDDEDEEVVVAEPTPPTSADSVQRRAALLRAAREYWDRQIERKYVPRAADIAHEVGIPLATAREYRALWKLEPKAHALLEAAYHEHGIADTGTFPAIVTSEPVLAVNGATAGR